MEWNALLVRSIFTISFLRFSNYDRKESTCATCIMKQLSLGVQESFLKKFFVFCGSADLDISCWKMCQGCFTVIKGTLTIAFAAALWTVRHQTLKVVAGRCIGASFWAHTTFSFQHGACQVNRCWRECDNVWIIAWIATCHAEQGETCASFVKPSKMQVTPHLLVSPLGWKWIHDSCWSVSFLEGFAGFCFCCSAEEFAHLWTPLLYLHRFVFLIMSRSKLITSFVSKVNARGVTAQQRKRLYLVGFLGTKISYDFPEMPQMDLVAEDKPKIQLKWVWRWNFLGVEWGWRWNVVVVRRCCDCEIWWHGLWQRYVCYMT